VKTQIIKIDSQKPEEQRIAQCAKILKSGGLVAFPTETVYGLGANLLNKKAILSEMMGLIEGKGFSLVSGYIALVAGLVTILLHNAWVSDWTLSITIIGWLSLILW